MSALLSSAHIRPMSDSTEPQKAVIHDFQIDRLIEATKKTFDDWLEKVVAGGPEAQTAINELAACSARYNLLMTLKRGYLHQY